MPASSRKYPAAPPQAVRESIADTRQRSLLDPIITMNAGGIIQSASDAVKEVFGWTPTELFGQNVKILIPEPRRSALDRYLDRYRHADRTKTLQKTQRFDAVRKDGSSIRIELSMSRADLPVHEAPFFIGIVRDVSRQIDVGNVSPGDRSRLQQLIMDQTRALATANLRLLLADRLASLGTLAAGLGHDMNNVLLPVRARLNALEHAGISQAALAHLKAVRRSVAYLQHLSDGLHFLALDPDGPGIAADGEGTTDLAAWWKQVGSLLRKSVPSGVAVTASLPPSLPHVKIAPHWLTQAMLNLIVNAGESVPSSRRGARVRIWALPTTDGGFVRLGVTDNGKGMSHDTQRRAFDLFFTTKSRGMGTGLGLPLVRKVAARSGGSVQIRSEVGKGTTIELRLPVVPRPVAAASSTRTIGSLVALSLRSRRTTALITQILVGAGARVRATIPGGIGVADVLVTEPTGRALTAAMRWRTRGRRRVIVLLGAPTTGLRKSWEDLGASIIDHADDFEAIRHALGEALSGVQAATKESKV